MAYGPYRAESAVGAARQPAATVGGIERLTPSPRLLHQLVTEQAVTRPDATALFWEHRTIGYAALAERIRRVATALGSTTSPGDRVAVLSWNRPEVLELLYAVPMAGRVAVPLNARLHPAELTAQLAQVGATLLIGEADLLAPLGADRPTIEFGVGYEAWLDAAGAPSLEPEPGDDAPAWIIFTSGSTGRPKGAVLTHRSLIAAISAASGARPVAPDDCYLYPFPLFHVSAYNVLIQHRAGRPVVLQRGFDADEVMAACVRHGVTTMSLAPTMMSMLLDHPSFDVDALRTVRTIGYGASAIAEPLLRRMLTELGAGLSQGYGATELSGNACFLDADGHRRAATARPELLRSAGRPAPGVELRIAADGELLVRAPQVMAGYWNEPELSAATVVDGWLHTGDIGRIDDDGYLFIVDRKKDLIISGGENIASREVEDAIGEHPSVASAAVVGVPDERWGEAVCAVVVVAAGAAVTESEVVAHCRDRLAGYKRPRHVVFRTELPVNANGKVDKPMLRSWASEQLADRSG